MNVVKKLSLFKQHANNSQSAQVFVHRYRSFETAKICQQADQACDPDVAQWHEQARPLCNFYHIMSWLRITHEAISNTFSKLISISLCNTRMFFLQENVLHDQYWLILVCDRSLETFWNILLNNYWSMIVPLKPLALLRVLLKCVTEWNKCTDSNVNMCRSN